jgi:hypothetical protein
MPDGVSGNISEFESDALGSNLSPVTDGGCSLFGKASDCESEEQGSNPAAHPKWFIVQWKDTTLRT